MQKAAASDVSVIVFSSIRGVAETMRMALRGMGVRTVFLAGNGSQLLEGFASAGPDVAIVYVDTATAGDPGMQTLNFMRRSEACPNRAIPIVVVSQQRDMGTIQAAANAGAHEYVLFPVAGDTLLRKVHAALNSNRVFIDTPEYVGPERRLVPRSE